jgi:acetoin utilization protein AcuB
MQPSDTVTDAVEALQAMNVRHLPIVDAGGQLVGMVSDRDLVPFLRTLTAKAEADNEVLLLSQRRIADLMSADPVSVELDADVHDVVDLMLEERVGAVPVVDSDGGVAGIISYVDVLRTLA